MATNADAVTVEWDEDGLHLFVFGDEEHDFRVANPEELLTAVWDAVAPWLAERGAARVSMPARDDSDGYALDDPKSPGYHDRMSGLYDNRAGK
jgi:hypothetical protein